jgi:hypothetical protein
LIGRISAVSRSNKYIGGKLHRYYYYRCTSTLRQDWETCPVKQVSAERIENFCLKNLERISVDKNYIENLVFRLNNDEQGGVSRWIRTNGWIL